MPMLHWVVPILVKGRWTFFAYSTISTGVCLLWYVCVCVLTLNGVPSSMDKKPALLRELVLEVCMACSSLSFPNTTLGGGLHYKRETSLEASACVLNTFNEP